MKNRSPGQDTNVGKQESDSGTPESSLTRTPLFEAMHAERYLRQQLIRSIQRDARASLICYVSGNGTSVARDDVLPFEDLLCRLKPGSDLQLLLHTGGGDIDAAEKVISMVRAAVGSGTLCVVVPDYAKSAGTLMALGASKILMSDTSELGPIDPQIDLHDANGNVIRHSVQNYLDAYEMHSATLRERPEDGVARIMLEKLDPSTVKYFEAVRDRARKFAEQQLLRGMQITDRYTAIANDLLNTKKWQHHGQMIGADDAKQMGLNVEYLSPSSPMWQAYWRLYCLQRLAVKDGQKLFESDYVSLSVEGR